MAETNLKIFTEWSSMKNSYQNVLFLEREWFKILIEEKFLRSLSNVYLLDSSNYSI